MRIAMIGQKRVPSREGGIEVVVTELSVHMAALSHQVDCYNRWEPNVQKNMPKIGEYKGVRLLRVRTSPRDSLNAILYAFKAVTRALLHRYNIIHLHAEGPSSMALLTHFMHVPTVVTIHGLDWQRAKWGGFATKFLHFGEKMAAKYADELIVLSRSDQKYFEDTYQRKTLLISNGVDIRPPVEPDLIVKRWNLKKDGYLLFIARIVPEKGLHYLLDAFLKIKTDKRLVIAGKLTPGNPYVAKIREMAARDPRVLMTDFVQDEAVGELYSNCCVFVLPSDIEGMSISLLEALSYGKRCVLSDIDENRETANEYGCYFAHGDTDDLKKQLEAVLFQSDTLEAREARIAYIADRYSWERVTAETLKTYRTVSSRYQKNGRDTAKPSVSASA